jgi:SEC-C motif-containing protein
MTQPAACPCGGGTYSNCCRPLIAGAQAAVTAEQLMRSRYSAFALAARDPQAIEHLLRTHPETAQTPAARRKALRASCRTIEWIGLTVLDGQSGGPLDQHGTVTFEARWRDRHGGEGVVRECSRFGRGESGEWLYLEALSAACESKATTAVPRAASPEAAPPGSESAQGS